MFLQIITSGTKLQNVLVLCEVICQVETGRTRSPSWSVFFCFFTELTTAQYCQMHCKTLQRALCRQQSSVPFWVRVLQHPILQRDALCECIPRFATQLLRTKHTKLYVEHSCRFLPLRSWKCKLEGACKRQRQDLWRLSKLVEAGPNGCNADCKISNKGKSELKQFKPHRSLRCCKKQ